MELALYRARRLAKRQRTHEPPAIDAIMCYTAGWDVFVHAYNLTSNAQEALSKYVDLKADMVSRDNALHFLKDSEGQPKTKENEIKKLASISRFTDAIRYIVNDEIGEFTGSTSHELFYLIHGLLKFLNPLLQLELQSQMNEIFGYDEEYLKMNLEEGWDDEAAREGRLPVSAVTLVPPRHTDHMPGKWAIQKQSMLDFCDLIDSFDLEEGLNSLYDMIKNMITSIEGSFDMGHEEIVLFRGEKRDTEIDLLDELTEENQTLQVNTFLSTSEEESLAAGFAGKHCCIYKLHVLTNVPRIIIHSHITETSMAGEREILLAKGCKYTLKQETMTVDKWGSQRTLKHVDVTYDT